MLAPEIHASFFRNRSAELTQLEDVWSLPRAQLLTLWGRRRVGKSALLGKFASNRRGLYIYGTRLAERTVLQSVATQAAAVFDDPYLREAPFPTWESALDYTVERARSDRSVLILDELPYLCQVSPGLDTLLQRWWDQHARSSNLMVVLAGSAFSFMHGLTGATGALHGRRTSQLEVHPFNYTDAALFFPELAPVDRIRAYACFGGIPAYLEHWISGASLKENLHATMLQPGHTLFREAEELLRTEFHQEALYASILRAVSMGHGRPSDIAQAAGKRSANDVAEYLRPLVELRFLRREVPITEQGRPRSHHVLYRLADPYLRFWYRFVQPFQALLQLGRVNDVWARELVPTLDEFIARTTWEEVCQQHLWLRIARGTLPADCSAIGRWWDAHSEIDIVGLWQGRATVIGECKWSNQSMGMRDLTELQRKAAVLDLADRPLWVLASRTGFTEELQMRATGGDVLLLEPGTMF
ncbi:MAG: ATP-binding protein [Chloroflexota bacterium]